jgi:hypothetical protein
MMALSSVVFGNYDPMLNNKTNLIESDSDDDSENTISIRQHMKSETSLAHTNMNDNQPSNLKSETKDK